MATDPTLSHLEVSLPPADGSPSADSSRELLQERLVFFARVACVLCLSFYVLANFLFVTLGGGTWSYFVSSPHNWFHLLAAGILGGMWFLAARGSPSLVALRRIDSTGVILTSLAYALVSWTQVEIRGDYQALLGLTNTLIFRAILVPCRARTSLWVGATAAFPVWGLSHVVYSRPEIQSTLTSPPHYASAILALWCLVAVIVSSLISHVIHGLRREVTEARKLGQYTLERKIGAGGMGEVYLARHAFLRRPTAVKLLRPGTSGERGLQRFEREVQLTSRLTHPNTIAIYDYGRTPDGVFYYAMEYLPGLNLDELVREEGAQPPGRVIHLLRQICASLGEAHAGGLIHRDIKAANVILCERGGTHDFIKVVDFGLVKDLEGLGDPGVSAANTITGTPHYLSPEGIRSPASVDARSDLYAVGVLGYLLLTGKQVFEAASFVEICGHHLHTRPVSPSVRLGRALPQDLEVLILSTLEKDPALRPASAAALSSRLERCAASGTWGEAEAAAWWRKRGGVGAESAPAPDPWARGDAPTVTPSAGPAGIAVTQAR